MKLNSLKPFNIIFDIDGVIVDSEQLHFDVLKDIAPKHTANIKAQDLIGLSLDETLNYIGIPEHEHELIIKEIIYAYTNKLSILYIRPGIKELISFLQKMHIPFGFVSTALRDVCLTNLSLLNLKNAPLLIARENVIKTKPYPDPYLKMLSLMGISAENAIVIEDTDIGIQAARSAGIPKVYAWPHSLSTKETYRYATKVISNISDILADNVNYMPQNLINHDQRVSKFNIIH